MALTSLRPGESAAPLYRQYTYAEAIKLIIERDGFSIHSKIGDPHVPVLSYTVGLVTSALKCEIFVLHYDDRIAERLLVEAARRLLGPEPPKALQVFFDSEKSPLRLALVHNEDGIKLCSALKWLMPSSVAGVKFYHLQVGTRSEPGPKANYVFPKEGHQLVKQYIARSLKTGYA